MLPIAVDAMGHDRGPSDIVAGARRAAEQGAPVVLVGRPEELGDTGGLEVWPASEVIEMTDDVAAAVRRKKDSSVVRSAEAVRDGRAGAMVSAGNTGAAMGAALLRMGRIPGISRPGIATTFPVPGSGPTVILDVGANPECSPEMLVQFAQMGAAFCSLRHGIERPRTALLSNGEESSKGTSAVKAAHALLADPTVLAGSGGTFIGNVEGRDLLTDNVDVVVTDGFTGNVVLKALEGGMKFMRRALFGIMTSTPEAQKASEVLLPLLLPLVKEMDPDTYGGAVLLGVDGVCIISHASSSPDAVCNAVLLGRDMVACGLVDRLRQSLKV
ncbi:MAG TPA: phosphate acyltransferase PlsX [Acidimicrobiales bacterium]|nr:phosphate acyltransferase PlsX [Acidimicrobiales bacterium]